MPTMRHTILTALTAVLAVISGAPHARTSPNRIKELVANDWRARYFAEHPVTDVEQYVVILGDDIKLPLEDLRGTFRKGKWPPGAFNWPDNDEGWPEVPYKFGDDRVKRSAIQETIDHWEEHTCLRFKDIGERTLQPHIVFKESNFGCASLIGRVPFMLLGQTIELAKGCQLSKGTIIHEIGHAIGFYHEQSRSDRDEHLIVNLKNMELHSVFNNFKALTENYGTPYDLYSIMHYGMLSFSNNGGSTLVTRDPLAQGLMGANDDTLSHMDKRTVNLMYKCNEKWAKSCPLSVSPCQNFGYLKRDCTCECPPGTAGTHCENLQQSYTDALKARLLPHNREMREEGNISSPGYPTPSRGGLQYTVRIVAPACHKVLLQFYDFNMWERCSNQNKVGLCCVDGLEMRLDGERPDSGKWYCGSEIRPGNVFESEENVLVLYHTTFNYDSLYFVSTFTGYFAKVKFRLDNACKRRRVT